MTGPEQGRGLTATTRPEQGRGLTVTTRYEHAWEAGRAVWHGVYAVLALLVAVLATVVDDLTAGRQLAVLALLAAGTAAYVLLGAPGFACAGRPSAGRWYAAIVIPVAVAGFAVSPAFSLLLFAVYAQLWALLEYREAVA